jgi:hypothetical protein
VFLLDCFFGTMPEQEKTETRKSALRAGSVTDASVVGASPPPGPPPGKSARVEDGGLGMEVEGSAFTPGLAAGSAGGVVKDLFGEELPAVPPDSDEEPSLKTLLKAMQKMDSNLGGKIDRVQEQFESIQIQFKDLKETVQKLEENSVTKDLFQKLEERVVALEQGGLPSTQMNWMSQQVNRLDPANKSLAIKGLTEFDAEKRSRMIEDILTNVCSKTDIQNIEHIGKGPKDNRSMSGVSVIEMSSRSVRETCLKKLQEDNSILKKPAHNMLSVARAKTAVQKKRNDALHRACDVLKKEDRSKNKSVTIEWQIDDSKDRSVSVDKVPIFLQRVTDLTGSFLSPFQDVIL